MGSNEDAIEMFVGGLVLDPNTQAPVVLLKDESGDVCLPIWIGVAEATSIASAMKQVPMARPLTHDLFYDVLQETDVSVQRIVITELRDSTYYAELVLSLGERALVFDSRPSDAIAIAVRASAPIFVTKSVVESAKMSVPPPGAQAGGAEKGGEPSSDAPEDAEGGAEFATADKERWTEILDSLDPDDFKYKM